jgi:hypothetical protein
VGQSIWSLLFCFSANWDCGHIFWNVSCFWRSLRRERGGSDSSGWMTEVCFLFLVFFWWGGRFLSLEIGVSSPGILKSPLFLLGNINVSIRREKWEKGFLLKLNLLSYTHFSVWSSLCASLYNFKYWVLMFMQNLGRLVCVFWFKGGTALFWNTRYSWLEIILLQKSPLLSISSLFPTQFELLFPSFLGHHHTFDSILNFLFSPDQNRSPPWVYSCSFSCIHFAKAHMIISFFPNLLLQIIWILMLPHDLIGIMYWICI